MERATVSIDGGYFAKLLKMDFSRPKVDFYKFSENVCEGYEWLRTYYYHSPNSVHDKLLSAVDESFMITADLIEKAKL